MDYKFKLLLELSKLSCIDDGDLEETFRHVTEYLAKGLQIERASIWFYSAKELSIVARDIYQVNDFSHSSGIELFAKDFPNYFSYLTEERTLAANDARSNPATSEFTEVYLKPLNIISMLDAPIRIKGKMVGLVCNESVGKEKIWSFEDQVFVGNVCDIISRALLASERMKALNELANLNQSLETIIEARTQELEEQRARSLHATKMASLGEMAGSIAHEINNPLAIILSTISMVRKTYGTAKLTPEKLMELLSNIEVTSLRIEKIVKGLKFFARDGSVDSHRPEQLLKIIEDTLTLCHEKLRIEECKVTVNVPEGLRVTCSSVGISHVLLNLISNSIDALEGKQEKWITISCVQEKERILLRVTDSGEGVPNEIREKIMLPFFTTKPIGKGTGLGLAIVRGIVEQHKGQLTFDEKNLNTSFVITLPAA